MMTIVTLIDNEEDSSSLASDMHAVVEKQKMSPRFVKERKLPQLPDLGRNKGKANVNSI